MSAQLSSIKIFQATLNSTVTLQVIYARQLDVSAFQQVDYYIPAGLTATISISSSDSSDPAAMVWTVVASSVAGASRDRKGSAKITALKIDRVSGSGIVETLLSVGFTDGGIPPTGLPGLAAYFEADQGITLDVSNNVSQWDDLSGNGAHFTQATALSRPGYSTTSFGGKPAVSLTQAANSFMQASPTIAAGAPNQTIITIAKKTGTGLAAYNGIVCIGSGSSGGMTGTIGTDSSSALWFGGAGLGLPTFGTILTNTYVFLGKTTRNVGGFGNDTAFINGVKNAPYTQPGAYNLTPANTLLLGRYFSGSSTSNWDVAAVILYNRILSDSEMAALAVYYKNKYPVLPY